jgi:PIN domain nuclease of toxin-antitoxin system
VIALDAHAWIWWVAGSRKLSVNAKKACAASEVLLISAICVWEVAMLVARERIGFDRDVELWIKQALALPGVRLEPLTPAIAVRSTRLPGNMVGDPADRIITATAMEYGVSLVTRDRNLAEYPYLRTVW